MQFLNQHSFLIASVILVIGVAYALLERGFAPWKLGVLAALVAVIAGALLAFRTTSPDMDSPAAVEAALRSGQPTVVEFYSNF